MKKIYVDDIKKKGDKSNPGPGKYESKKTFGDNGQNYSMAGRLATEKLMLEKSKKLPGPGSYESIQTTGKLVNNSSFKN